MRKKKTTTKKNNHVERCCERDDERVVVSLHKPSPPKGVSLFTRNNLQTLVQLEPTPNVLRDSFRVDDRDDDDERGRPPNESAKKTKQGRVRARPTTIGSKNGRSASRVDRFKREGKEERKRRKNSYDDGYLLRPASDGGIAGYIPLLGGALAIGNQWPSSYSSHSVPDYYVDYYDLGPRDSYRYADNVIYRVNPSDSAIQSVVALLTGDDFTIGEPMPSGYDVYNVPYPYRDRYNDSDDAWYRYSDGYVYQIDPQTQLISAAIDLLV